MEALKSNRPKKIVVIGGGDIGKELFKELAEELAGDNITLWNRTPPSEEMVTLPGAKKPTSEKGRFDGFLLGLQTAICESLDYIAEKRKLFIPDKAIAPELVVKYGYDNLDEAVKGADIVVLTAGIPRQKGQERPELLGQNAPIIENVAESVRTHASNAKVVIASNPVDTLTHYFAEKSGLPDQRVMGLSGVLDSARLRLSIAEKLQINPGRVAGAKVVGIHGDEMVPVLSQVRIQAKEMGATRYQTQEETLQEFIARKYAGDPHKRQEIVEDVKAQIEAEVADVYAKVDDETRNGGARFQPMVGKSDFIGPAHALKKMVLELNEHGHTMIASTWNQDAQCYIGQEVVIGMDGVKPSSAEPVNMSATEKLQWKKSVAAAQEAVNDLPGHQKAVLAATR